MWKGNMARPFFYSSIRLQEDPNFIKRAILTNRWTFDRLPKEIQCQERFALCYLKIMTELRLGFQFLAQQHFSELLTNPSFIEKSHLKTDTISILLARNIK